MGCATAVGMLEKARLTGKFDRQPCQPCKSVVVDEIYKIVNSHWLFVGGRGVFWSTRRSKSGLGHPGGVISLMCEMSVRGVSGGISNASRSAFATCDGMGQYLSLSTKRRTNHGPPTASGAMGYTAAGATMINAGSTLSAVATSTLHFSADT